MQELNALMPRCKTCAHWKVPGDRDHEAQKMCSPVDQDTYEPMAMGYEVRRCEQPTQGFCETPVERNGFALADASDYMAVMVTAEDFGCVRHEPRDT